MPSAGFLASGVANDLGGDPVDVLHRHPPDERLAAQHFEVAANHAGEVLHRVTAVEGGLLGWEIVGDARNRSVATLGSAPSGPAAQEAPYRSARRRITFPGMLPPSPRRQAEVCHRPSRELHRPTPPLRPS